MVDRDCCRSQWLKQHNKVVGAMVVAVAVGGWTVIGQKGEDVQLLDDRRQHRRNGFVVDS